MEFTNEQKINEINLVYKNNSNTRKKLKFLENLL